MSSSAKLSRPPTALEQTTRDATVERSSHVSCPHSQALHASDRALDRASTSASERELLEVGADRPAGASLTLPRASVADLMTRNVLCVRPELCLESATALFVESGLEALPVVDAGGNLLGFVSEAAVLREVRGACPSERRKTVCDLMTTRPLTLAESACITLAAALLAFERQSRLAVLSRTGKVVGILSASDVLYWLARADGHVLSQPRQR